MTSPLSEKSPLIRLWAVVDTALYCRIFQYLFEQHGISHARSM